MKKVVICYSIPFTFIFTTEIIERLKNEGYHVILISSNEKELMEVANSLNVDYVSLKITRDFSVFRDVLTLIKMIFVFRKLKPFIVIGATPKAALLSMIASKVSGVKHRIYHIFGLPYETAKGFKRKILISVEMLTSLCATNVIPISNSLSIKYGKRFKIINNKISKIGSLSIAGVDTKKFDDNKFVLLKDKIKTEVGIPNDFFIIGFVARLTVDKGVGDLIELWKGIKIKYKKVALLLIGDQDSRDGFDIHTLNDFLKEQNVYHLKHTFEVEKYMSIMDVFVLPSFREGFGNVNVEASAMKVPVVSYNVTGCKDSVLDGFSGFLVEKNNIEALISKVSYFIDSPIEKERIGNQGRLYVEQNFTRDKVALDFVNYINTLN